MLLGGRILLVCAAISPKMGTATKENGDCPYPGRGTAAHGNQVLRLRHETSSVADPSHGWLSRFEDLL